MKTVLIFGDSIAHGVGGQEAGWTDKVKATLNGQLWQENTGTVLYELGIPGDTARDVLGRFEIELLARVPHKNPNDVVVVFAVGVNDSKANHKPENIWSDPDTYTTTMQACITAAKEHVEHVVCVGLLPVDEARTNPRHTLSGDIAYFSNHRIKQLETALIDLCKKQKVTCVPLFTETPSDWQERFLADGLHPNDAGHEWVFGQVMSKLKGIL